jgi:hypothetical protein
MGSSPFQERFLALTAELERLSIGLRASHTSPTRQRGSSGRSPSLARRAGIRVDPVIACATQVFSALTQQLQAGTLTTEEFMARAAQYLFPDDPDMQSSVLGIWDKLKAAGADSASKPRS